MCACAGVCVGVCVHPFHTNTHIHFSILFYFEIVGFNSTKAKVKALEKENADLKANLQAITVELENTSHLYDQRTFQFFSFANTNGTKKIKLCYLLH